MPAEIHFRTPALLIWRPCGLVDTAAIRRYLEFLEDVEANRRPAFARFNDLSLVTGAEVGFGDVSGYAMRRRSFTASFLQDPVQVAFLAPGPVTFGLARMYQNLLDSAKTRVRVFTSRSDAAAWLEVDVSLLEPPEEPAGPRGGGGAV